MKYLPIEYRLFLVALIAFLLMTGIYAIADGATMQLDGQVGTDSLTSSSAFAESPSGELDWYQEAAIFVCPLH